MKEANKCEACLAWESETGYGKICDHNKPISTEWEKEFDELFSGTEFHPPFIKHAVYSEDIKSFIRKLITTQQTAHEQIIREQMKDVIAWAEAENAIGVKNAANYRLSTLSNKDIT